MNIVVIHAGGYGSRMEQKKNKIFLKLGEKTILAHTIKKFDDHAEIDRIMVTAKLEDFKQLKKILESGCFNKVTSMIRAGESRQESSFLAIKKLMNLPRKTLILIHNAVNPFVKCEEISKVIKAARKFGAGILAYPVKDTIKEFSGGKIRTLKREVLWAAQTPQAFCLDIGLKAYQKAARDKYTATDDAGVIENYGHNVKLIPCSERNFKITYSADLILARQLINSEEKNV